MHLSILLSLFFFSIILPFKEIKSLGKSSNHTLVSLSPCPAGYKTGRTHAQCRSQNITAVAVPRSPGQGSLAGRRHQAVKGHQRTLAGSKHTPGPGSRPGTGSSPLGPACRSAATLPVPGLHVSFCGFILWVQLHAETIGALVLWGSELSHRPLCLHPKSKWWLETQLFHFLIKLPANAPGKAINRDWPKCLGHSHLHGRQNSFRCSAQCSLGCSSHWGDN